MVGIDARGREGARQSCDGTVLGLVGGVDNERDVVVLAEKAGVGGERHGVRDEILDVRQHREVARVSEHVLPPSKARRRERLRRWPASGVSRVGERPDLHRHRWWRS
jgi:hypothetical protein